MRLTRPTHPTVLAGIRAVQAAKGIDLSQREIIGIVTPMDGKGPPGLLVVNEEDEEETDVIQLPENYASVEPVKEISHGHKKPGTKPEKKLQRPINDHCKAVPACVTQCHTYRKIVSHIFGRNKACTQALPEAAWIFWCRKHYQRLCFRSNREGNWHLRQLLLVRQQLQQFEEKGLVESWTIALSRSEKSKSALGGSLWKTCLGRFLGEEKSYDAVRAVLDIIENQFEEPAFMSRSVEDKSFPGVEFLPSIPLKSPKVVGRKRKNETENSASDDDSKIRRPTKRRRHLVRGLVGEHPGRAQSEQGSDWIDCAQDLDSSDAAERGRSLERRDRMGHLTECLP